MPGRRPETRTATASVGGGENTRRSTPAATPARGGISAKTRGRKVSKPMATFGAVVQAAVVQAQEDKTALDAAVKRIDQSSFGCLRLDGQGLTPDDVGAIAAVLLADSRRPLVQIDADNNPELGEAGAAQLANVLSSRPEVTALSLRACALDDRAMDQLVDAVDSHRGLRRLDLRGNLATTGAVARVCDAMARCPKLETVAFDSSHVPVGMLRGRKVCHIDGGITLGPGSEGDLAAACAAASANGRLQELALVHCDLDGEGAAEALAGVARACPELAVVDVGHNPWRRGLAALGAACAEGPALTAFKALHTQASLESVALVVAAFATPRARPPIALLALSSRRGESEVDTNGHAAQQLGDALRAALAPEAGLMALSFGHGTLPLAAWRRGRPIALRSSTIGRCDALAVAAAASAGAREVQAAHTSQGGPALVGIVRDAPALRLLDLSNCALGSAAFGALAAALVGGAGGGALEHLSVSRNRPGPGGVIALAEALLAAPLLSSLDLSASGLRAGGPGQGAGRARTAMAHVGGLARRHGALSFLRAGGNDLGDEGVGAFCEAAAGAGVLEALDLRNTHVGRAGVAVVAALGLSCPMLRELLLGGNPASTHEARAVAAAAALVEDRRRELALASACRRAGGQGVPLPPAPLPPRLGGRPVRRSSGGDLAAVQLHSASAPSGADAPVPAPAGAPAPTAPAPASLAVLESVTAPPGADMSAGPRGATAGRVKRMRPRGQRPSAPRVGPADGLASAPSTAADAGRSASLAPAVADAHLLPNPQEYPAPEAAPGAAMSAPGPSALKGALAGPPATEAHADAANGGIPRGVASRTPATHPRPGPGDAASIPSVPATSASAAGRRES